MPTPFSLTTPLPPNTLRFEGMTHVSALSTLEDTRLSLLADKPDVDPNKLLGQLVELTTVLRDGSKRYVNGYVTRFSMGRSQGRYYGYEAELKPWLWFLTRTADCRIFQDKTVREIVETVFKDHGSIANFEFKLTRSYRKRVYCVQYRETDFNFIARLLEDEGIFWFFRHTAGAHKLVIADSASAHQPMPGDRKLPYHDNTGAAPPDVEFVSRWNYARAVKSGASALTSYDFEKPSTKLLVEQSSSPGHDQGKLEVFDFAGDYTVKSDGQQLCDDRLDEQRSRADSVAGRCNAQAMATGQLFTLERHARSDQNGEYICAQAEISVRENPSEAGGGASDWQCGFTAMKSDTVYRPERRTPKPCVQGPHTAIVVGPGGEEIHTDKYGRVKVQFHWDRYGKKDNTSSCWVRVSTPWAGKSFGFVQVPRIGQEVVVDFLEGDPDQPIITGRVYNAEQMPPWELPANATQSGVLTRSSKGGAYGNANALRFEDKKGSEQVWLHAEKNQDIEVENDETHWVGHDRKKTVDHDEVVQVKHDRIEQVDNDESITIGHDRTMKVVRDKSEMVLRHKIVNVGVNHSEVIGSAMSLTVGSTLTETIAVNHSEAVGGAMEITVGAAMAITVGAVMSEAVGGAKSQTVGGNLSTGVGRDATLNVGKNLNETIAENRSTNVKKDFTENIDGKHTVEVKKEATVKAKKVQITADDEISFKTGSAEIIMKKNGDITIKGGKININGSGDVVIKGSKVAQN